MRIGTTRRSSCEAVSARRAAWGRTDAGAFVSRTAASGAIDAFSRRPLCPASRQFTGPILNGSKGSELSPVRQAIDGCPVIAQSGSARSSEACRSTRAHRGAGGGLVADGCVGVVGPKIGEGFLPRFNFLLCLAVNAAIGAILLSFLLRSVGASGWGAGR